MSTFRVNKNSNYTVMSNSHLRDKELSLKAKGLLSVMLSLPEDWDYSINGLAAICMEGESAVKTALKELKHQGYLVIRKVMPDKTETGRIEYIYDVYEVKQTDKQEGDFLPLEILPLENRPQLNTKEVSTKELSTDPKPLVSTDLDERFRCFVDAYPKPVNEYELYRLWIASEMTDELYQNVMDGLEKWKKSEQWTKNNGQYIANAVVWFREKRWRFEPPKRTEQKAEHTPSFDSDAMRRRAQNPENYVYRKK